jgi:streptogramin lyase
MRGNGGRNLGGEGLHSRLTWAGVVVVALLIWSLAPLDAAAANEPAAIPQLELNSYKNDFHVSAAAAEHNLAVQQRGAGIVELLKGTLGKEYAGVWFDNERGEFVAPTLTSPAAIAAALRGLHLEGDFRTTEARFSWQELEAAQKSVNGALKKAIAGKQLTQSYLDPKANSVVIREAKGLGAAGEAAVDHAAASEPGKVQVERLAAPRLSVSVKDCTSTSPRVCGRPLRGGTDIGKLTPLKGGGYYYGNGVCSAGFKATGKEFGNKFMLTAGHCAALYGTNNWAGETPVSEILKIGDVGSYTFGPGGDWAAINANSSEWGTSGWPTVVANYSGNLQYPISIEEPSYVGEYACISGARTGTHCNPVTFTNLKGLVDDLTGTELPPEDAIAGVCTIPGDSGGPVFGPSSELALGLLSAGTEGEGCYALYTEITDATDSLGVSVGYRYGGPPAVETAEGELEEEWETGGPARGVDEVHYQRVTAHGSVDPNGIVTTYYYQYGLTTGYGSLSSFGEAGSGWGPSPRSMTLTGLKGSSTYHYRIYAENVTGTIYGHDRTFTTPSWLPIVTTNAPTGVIHQEATLNGSVNPQGGSTSYHFEYGFKGPCGANPCTSVPIPDASVGSGESAVNVSRKLTGLEDGNYNYRIVATNGEGTSYGGNQTFVIDNRPLIKGTSATNVTSGSATLKGEIEPQNFASTFHFELVRDSEFKADGFTYARKVPVPDASAGTGFEWHVVSQETGTLLEPDTVYHYRLVATNVKGTRIGEEKTLRTPPTIPVSDFTFGSPGSGPGQLSAPGGLGEDESGNLWVADTGNSRLEKFSSEGAFISMFGKHGSGKGEFLTVTDAAWMGNKTWALDSGRDRLLGFSAEGQEESWRGEGQFANPMGIAVNQGIFQIWVSDRDLHHVQQWGISGEAVKTVTGGSGNGPALEGPVGIAYGNSNDIWVADSTAGRVLQYSNQGYYQSSFGESGTGAGQLNHPARIAILPSGDVVVTDGDSGAKNARIQVFSSAGEYLATFVGPQGPTFGDLLYTGGYLYATETGEGVSRVRRWHFPQAKVTSEGSEAVRAEKAILTGSIDPGGTKTSYHFEYGTTKAYGSQMPVPDTVLALQAEQEITGLLPSTTYHYRLVAVNSSGASYGEDKTFKTASAKAPSVTHEAVSAITATQATFKGTVNPNGVATTYRFDYVDAAHWAVSHFASASTQQIPVPDQSIGSGTSPVAVSQTPTNLQPNTLYHVRLRATNAEGTIDGENRTFTTLRTFNPPTYSSSFGSKGTGNGQFENPQGIATDPSGNVWVSDVLLHRIQKFNSKGEYQCKFGTYGTTGNGQFSSPRGLAADSSGNVWVIDYGNSRVQEANSNCEYLSQFGKFGSANGELQNPRDVAVDPSGNIWVADTGNRRIEKFNAKGEYLAKCGFKGSGDGQFSEGPLSIDIDADGNVWAGDESRIEEFDSKCAFLAKFDKASSGAPAKVQPAPSAIDPEGNLWVPSAEGHGVQGFFPEGEYLTSFGKEGTGAGQFTEPTAVAAAPDGTLWVIDHGSTTERIEKWVPGAPYPVQTGRAASIKRSTATLTAKVNPEGTATSYQFEWGTGPSFGNKVPASPKSIGSGSTPVAVSEALSGLKYATTYYYHVLATSSKGTTYGETRHFTTAPGPGAEAKWRIGGKTLAELGLKEESFSLSGTFKMEIPKQLVTFSCAESGSGKISGTNTLEETMTLKCVIPGQEKNCTYEPVTLSFSGTATALKPTTEKFILDAIGELCSWPDGQVYLVPSSLALEVGSEAAKVPTQLSATGSFGSNTMLYSNVSSWGLAGANAGKEVGFR